MAEYRKGYRTPVNSKRYHQGRDERKFKSEYVGKPETIQDRRFVTSYPQYGGSPLPRIFSRSHVRPSKRDLEDRRKRREGTLESLAHKLRVLISFGSIISGGFFLSNKLTGFAIGNLSQSDANVTGVVLFVFGILGLLLFLRK